MTAVTTQVLHIANGTATTRLIAQAGLPGARSIWADPLYEGPVPSGVSDDELSGIRTHYLAGAAPDAAADPVNDLRAWRAVIAAPDYDELVLWYEHDLFDQLNLVQLLAWLSARGFDRQVTLISVGSVPGRTSFRGYGELTATELAALFPTRQPVTPGQFALAADVWSAFREPAPDGLSALRRADTSALPFIAPALTRLLQELPWTGDGLSRTERAVVRLASRRLALPEIIRRLGDGEQFYYPTDLTARRLTRELSASLAPLVATTAGDSDRNAIVSTTALGEQVLAGHADRVSACGIDRWLGGVHLRPGHVWRWNERGQRVERD